MEVFVGVDLGSSMTKAVLIDKSTTILARTVRRSGTDFTTVGEQVLKDVFRTSGREKDDLTSCVTTGYGRKAVTFSQSSITEITCTAKGSYHLFPMESTVIDIGGQDTKVIKIDESGRRRGFKMNRKCAAGTGAFLEEIAAKMGIPLGDLDSLAKKATEDVRLNSFCTVFSSTEILERIADGEAKENMIRGAMDSVARRVLEMDSLRGELILVGGVVAHNPTVVEIISKLTEGKVHVPEDPHTVGALGAALLAKNM